MQDRESALVFLEPDATRARVKPSEKIVPTRLGVGLNILLSSSTPGSCVW